MVKSNCGALGPLALGTDLSSMYDLSNGNLIPIFWTDLLLLFMKVSNGHFCLS